MIGYLNGKVLSIGADSALIEVGGVGYEVYCSGSAFSKMTEGGQCEVYTYLQVSEANGVQLYGFSSPQEKTTFLKLISVSGVGPKIGIAVLSQLSLNDVATAVVTADVKRLSSVKGLGKKTAERIILELRESMSLPAGAPSSAGASVIAQAKTSGDEDAVVALMSLGFSRAESERAVLKAKSSGATSVEDIIMLALKGM